MRKIQNNILNQQRYRKISG